MPATKQKRSFHQECGSREYIKNSDGKQIQKHNSEDVH